MQKENIFKGKGIEMFSALKLNTALVSLFISTPLISVANGSCKSRRGIKVCLGKFGDGGFEVWKA